MLESRAPINRPIEFEMSKNHHVIAYGCCGLLKEGSEYSRCEIWRSGYVYPLTTSSVNLHQQKACKRCC